MMDLLDLIMNVIMALGMIIAAYGLIHHDLD